MTTNNSNKEVRFDIYCKTCEYHEKAAYEDPCDECLCYAMREGTEKPLRWVEKEK